MLKEKLQEDLKNALKEKAEVVLSTLRMVLAAVKNKEIDKKGELADEEVIKVLQGEKKKHLESIQQFEAGGRADLAAKEKAEAAVIEKYLPAGLPEAELEKLVAGVVAEVGAGSDSGGDFGRIMKAAMTAVAGRADGAQVSAMVKKILNKK